jgi:hypothetical protein
MGLDVQHDPSTVEEVHAVEPNDLAWRLAGRCYLTCAAVKAVKAA